jgi:UPF0755 protein
VKYLVSFVMLLVVILMGRAVIVVFVPGGSADRPVVVDVPPGTPFVRVARELQDKGLIASALEFRIYAKLAGTQDSVKVGEYALDGDMNFIEIMERLSSGRGILHPVTIPEGFNIYEIAQRIDESGLLGRDEFLRTVKDPALVKELLGESRPSLEGYLFPETYQITKYSTSGELVRSMVRRFFEVYNTAVEPNARIKMPRHDIVILASIIEKETGAPEERGLISSVFHNRLQKNMLLQTDPTVLYGILEQTKVMKNNITKEDLQTPSRYNTYTQRGLPFGPIANPGAAALLAAVQPETSDYLFFVSRNDGTHVFSRTYADHNKGVREFQLDRKAREGKSWRDLNRRKRAKN